MLEFSWFVCGVFYAILYCYLFSNLVCEEKFIIDVRISFSSVIFGLFYYVIMGHNFGAIQPYLMHILIFILLKIMYHRSIVETLIGTFSIFILMFISELIFDLCFMVIFKASLIESLKNPIIYLISNFIILLIMYFISKIKPIKKVINNIINWYNRNEVLNTFVLIIIAMSIVMFLMYNNFIKLLPNSILWFTNLFCIGVMVFVIGFFKEKSNNNRIVSEYDQLLNYVKKYEKVIEEKSKNQHEYKNQLILIKGMISKTNKKAIQYIDELYNNEKEDANVELLKKLQYLPQGGLKGLIYYKVEEMINKGIDVYVDMSSELKKVKSKKQLNNNLQDISKILGVYIDNAIEAAMSSEQKYIIIESYLQDEDIVFGISNTYKGNVNLNKVDKEGYTTKGEGKGYGLSLVKDIIDKSNYLKQERSLNGIYYVQKLYIKK